MNDPTWKDMYLRERAAYEQSAQAHRKLERAALQVQRECDAVGSPSLGSLERLRDAIYATPDASR